MTFLRIVIPLYLLFEHDLRANASRLSRGKTGTHPRVKPEGMLFRIMLKGIADPVNGPCASASQAEAGVGSG
jgi:hypothetical protein